MARRNRKKTQAGFIFPVPLAVALVLLAGFSLFYVCLKAKTEGLGQQIKALEANRAKLQQDLIREQCEWARLQSPASVDQALKGHGLVMTWPGRDQIVRMRPDGTIDATVGPEMRHPVRVARYDRVVMND